MTELEKIKHLEYYFPKIFTDMEERDFGVMFYNTANPNSHERHRVSFTSNEPLCGWLCVFY